ncbi:hypothetical protein ACFY0G_02300 [Streptomyces sp. NPDC001552]|uniref:hypothetical protein n=1 Tax=Streptomyces sp. NPDC001552 TaxID=3364587 RepID=UPI0036831204
MTRAAAIALAAGGGLLENCVVVITDGPTIGTAGNTSVTEIELNPVSTTAFGQTARVFTTFAPEAWPGVYDLANNAITELRDDFGNTAKDVDATAPTVHTQFPWHLGAAALRDNYVEDATLTGWDTQVGPVSNNRVVGGTVNLTGKTAGSILDSTFTGATITLGAGGASATLIRTNVQGATVNQTGTGTLSMTDSDIRDGFIVAHSGSGQLTLTDTRAYNHGSATADVIASGSGQTLMNDSELISGTGAVALVNNASAATMALARIKADGGAFVKDAAVTGASMSVTDSEFQGCTVSQTAGVTSGTGLTISGSTVRSGTVTQNGVGPITLTNMDVRGSALSNSAAATRGTSFQSSRLSSATVTQNRTGGTGNDVATSESTIEGVSLLTLNGAVDPGMNQTILNRTRITATSSVTVTDPAAVPVILQNSEIHNSTVTVPAGGGLTTQSRISMSGANLGAFTGHGALIIDGIGAKTLTAVNVNRLANRGFDDTI